MTDILSKLGTNLCHPGLQHLYSGYCDEEVYSVISGYIAETFVGKNDVSFQFVGGSDNLP